MFRTAIIPALALGLAAGCAKPGVSGPVQTGRVLKDGKPYPFKPGEGFDLEFAAVQPDGSPGAVFRADVDREAATFELTGPQSNGVPAGVYKVRARHFAESGKALLPDKLGGPDTPLEVEITATPAPVAIDLGADPRVTPGP